jgi:hypothetical protein
LKLQSINLSFNWQDEPGNEKLEYSVTLEFLEAIKSYAIYSPTTPGLRDLVTDITPIETDFPVSFFGNRLAEAIEDLIDLDNETYGNLDLDDVLDLLDWTDNIAIGSPNAEILSPVVPRLQKVIRFMSENNNILTAYDASEGCLYIDADVAREDEINCAKPYPPIQDTSKALAQRVMTWLGEPVIDEKLVLCIPADNTEAWVLAAHDIETIYHAPRDKPLECVNKPDMIISNQAYQ